MLILTLRTDKPESEIGLYDDQIQTSYLSWEAHRQLAETILNKLEETLNEQHKSYKDIEGIVIYKGPGSFTGLRIGFSVANALADSLAIPIVSAGNDSWIKDGISNLLVGKDEKTAVPEYGAPARVTTQKK